MQKYVRVSRATLGMNQTEFGNELGVTTKQVSNWEKGKTPVAKRIQLAIDMVMINHGHKPVAVEE